MGPAASWISPDWPAPATVKACVSTRVGGLSVGAYASLNLADHVGDRIRAVAANRQILRDALKLPSEPAWLEQVHGATVIDAATAGTKRTADASFARRPGVVCAVLSADCLPIMLCTRSGDRVAVAHAGWRGLRAGVIESTVEHLATAPEGMLAWLGPAIGPSAFEVGNDVRDALLTADPGAGSAFREFGPGRFLADLYELARRRLRSMGLVGIFGGGACTLQDADRFFSYRRDGITGRMAALIWLDGAQP